MNLVMLGGNPQLGIKYAALSYQASFSGQLILSWTHFLQRVSTTERGELVFFDNSNRNLFFFILAYLIGRKPSYFVHGDHFMPTVSRQYSTWQQAKELIFLRLSSKIFSHSFCGLALPRKITGTKNTRFQRLKFPIKAYLKIRKLPQFPSAKVSSLAGFVASERENKCMQAWLNAYTEEIRTASVISIDKSRYERDLGLCKYFLVPSESETLCLSAIDAAALGVRSIIIHRRIGIKEYKKEFEDIFNCAIRQIN